MSNIIFLSTAHPYRGGIAAFNETLAKYLMSLGHSVRIITFTLQYPSFLFPGKTQYSSSPAPEGLDISRQVNSINPFNWMKVGLKIKKAKPDMLFVRYWSPYLSPALSTIARIAKSNKHTKVVALADNIIAHEPHFYDNILTDYFVGCCDEFMVMSREVENDLRVFTKSKKVTFYPHPIYENYGEKVSRDQACELLSLDKELRYSLFFGFVRDYKGLDILLDAWAKVCVKKGFEKCRLIVAGEYYSDKGKYIEQIERLGISDKVLMFDKFIDDDKVKYYFCASDSVIQPYKSATQSGVTQIAYNFDTPMIVTNVGGLAEIVFDGESGYVVEPNADDVAVAIEQLYSSDAYKEISQKIPNYKDRFSWKTFANKLAEMV
ncbi:MAG: glycosyltransferase [Rikenellaceae bacterium]